MVWGLSGWHVGKKCETAPWWCHGSLCCSPRPQARSWLPPTQGHVTSSLPAFCPCATSSEWWWNDLRSFRVDLAWLSNACCALGSLLSIYKTSLGDDSLRLVSFTDGETDLGKVILFQGHTTLRWQVGIWTPSCTVQSIIFIGRFFFWFVF